MSFDMEHHAAGYLRRPTYDGEDTRWTSNKELWGWYAYGWAAEVFAICALGSLPPGSKLMC